MKTLSPTPTRADACTAPITRKARARKCDMPFFAVQATASIFLDDSTSNSPDARIRVNFLISYKDEIHRIGRDRAQIVLRRFGIDQKMLDAACYEVEIESCTAKDARHVRNPDGKPVEAFNFYDIDDEKNKARLIKQRRLVPESREDMHRLYGPQPDTTVPAGGAA